MDEIIRKRNNYHNNHSNKHYKKPQLAPSKDDYFKKRTADQSSRSSNQTKNSSIEDDEYVPPLKKSFISNSGRPQQQNSKHHYRPNHQNHHKKKQMSVDNLNNHRGPPGKTEDDPRTVYDSCGKPVTGLSELDLQIIEDERREAERWNLYNWLGHGDLDPAMWNYEYRGWKKFERQNTQKTSKQHHKKNFSNFKSNSFY